MKKQALHDVLEECKDDYHFAGSGYHTPEEIMDVVRNAVNDYGTLEDEIADIDDMRDDLNECADSQTPIHTHDLLEWLKDNYSAYEETADEFGEAKNREGKMDLMRGIMQAYCWTLEQEAMEALQAVWNAAEGVLHGEPIIEGDNGTTV